MRGIFTIQTLAKNTLWIAVYFLFNSIHVLTAQTQVFADFVISESNVDVAANAIDGDLSTKAEIRAYSGRPLPLPAQPAYTGELEMQFSSLLPANTTSYVKIDTDDNLFPALIGGNLGGVLAQALGLVLIGEQEFTVEALNNTTVVLSGDSAVENDFAQSNLKIVVDAAGDYYIAITPTLPYNRIKLTNRLGTLIGLNTTKRLGVYGAYYVSDPNNCGNASFTSYDGSGLNLDALTIGGAGVTNPENVLDGNDTTYSQLSLGLVGFGASIEQIVYFEGTSVATDNFSIRLRLDPSLITVGVANSITIKGYNGDTLVQSTVLSGLLNLDLLTLLQSNQIATIPFTPGAPVDRIAVEFSSLVSASVTQRLDLFDIIKTPALPVIAAASQNVTICEGASASLVATANPASLQLKWYDAIVGGTLLATLNSGESFDTPILNANTTFYVATSKSGCTEESARQAVLVTVQANTLAPTLVLDANITSDDIINASEASGNVIIEGTAGGDAKVNDEVKLIVNSTEYTGLVGSDFRFSISVSGSDLVADTDKVIDASLETSDGICSRIVTDTEAYQVDIVNPTVPTVNSLTTNDTTPILTGTADSADILTVTVNGVTYTEGDGNLTDNTDNTWTLQIPTGNEITEGTYDVVATATDAAGNVSNDTTTNELTIDTTNPTVPTVDVLATNDTTPILTGTADSADVLTVTVNGVTYTEGDGNLTDNTDGTWTLQIPAGNEITEGTYDVVATATDAAGNVSNDTTTNELVIDTTNPAVPTVNSLTTNDTTPTLTGTADSADTLTVTVNGVTYTEGDGNLTDNTDGTWSLQIPTGNEITEGTYEVVATATDAAGNVSNDTTTNELVIDTTNPAVPTVNSLTTNDTTPTLTGTADSADTLTVTVNGVTYTEGDGNLTDNTDGTWSLQIPTGNEITEGTYEVVATATDAAGNVSNDTTTNELTIDTTNPVVPTVDVLATNDTTPILTGTADSADVLTVTVNGVTYTEGDGNLVDNTDGTWTLQVPAGNEITEGTYDIVATATDAAGNVSNDTTTNELTIDTTNPTVPTVDVLATNDTTPILTGTADSADVLTVTVNGVTYTEGDGNLVDNTDGTWTLQIPAGSEISEGTYDVVATATDAAGNVSNDATTNELTIDTTNPTVPTVDALATNDTTPILTGTADSSDNLTVTVNGITYTEGDGNLVDNTDGTWTLQIPAGSEISEGTYDVVATATDAAGNVSNDTTTNELVIDTTNPAVPTVDAVATNDTTPILTGTADSADTLTVTVNGVTYTEGDGNLVDNTDGTWTLQIPTGNEITEGTYDVVASSTDAAGNVSNDTTTNELTIDTTNPAVPTVDALATNDTTPILTGTADSADTLTVTVNGVTYTEGDGNLVDNTDGTWTLQIPTSNEITEGTYDVVATATDAAGNVSNDATTNELVIDTTNPTVPTVAALATNDTTPILTGTADSADVLTVTVNGVTYTEGDGNLVDNTDNTWTLQIPAGSEITEGNYDVVATATDAAGNVSNDTTTNELTIDTTNPTVPTVAALATNDTTPILTGTADSADVLTVTVNGVTYTEGDGNLTDNTDGTWSLQIPTGNEITEGTYDVVATATDAVGNVSNDATTNELTIDTTNPTVPTVDALATNDTTPILTGTADSADTLTVTVNGVTYTEGDGNLVDNTDNTWTLQVPAGNEITEGTYDVVATATDAAGNVSNDATTNELNIDTTNPAVPTVNALATNNTTPILTGIADSEDTLTVTLNGVTYTEGDGNLVDNTDGTWTLQIPTGNEINEGTYDVVATATDAAGNVSNDTTTDEITITSGTVEAPIVVIVEDVNNDGFINQTELNGAIDVTITLPAGAVVGETVTINGTPQTITASQEAEGEIRVTYSSPGEGNTLTVIATYTNATAVTSAEGQDEAIVDTTMPITPTVDEQETSDTTPLITGTADSDDDLMVEVDGEMYHEGDGDLVDHTDDTWSLQIPDNNELDEGVYDIVVEAIDTAGNVATDQTTNEITLISKAASLVTDLGITKEVDNMNPSIGETVVFTITVQNLGQTTINSIEVSEVIQSGFTFSNAKATDGDYDLSSSLWMIPTLEPSVNAVLTITVEVNESGEYSNTAIVQSSIPADEDTTNNSSEIELEISCLRVFNEFTPNNDGSNDFLRIDCIEKYTESTFEVYNRYGNLVYQSQAYKNDWDGMSNVSGVVQKGKTLPTGTYFYVLKVDPTAKEKTGWIYIGR
ncbi:Ig-like domain-containing protein [Aquimarina sp. 2-A2]|uniref:Ig-like domain-containing protein n=1 Tax=Aquimarina sp. 2-A2 TaxID=3382644 RepID=UPI00387F20D1